MRAVEYLQTLEPCPFKPEQLKMVDRHQDMLVDVVV